MTYALKKHEPIKYGDAGKLLSLVGSLYDRSTILLEKKINQYLKDATSAVLVFLIHEQSTKPKAIIRVIGDHVLPRKIELESDGTFLETIREVNGANLDVRWIDAELQIELKHLLLSSYFKILENFLAIPIYHPLTNKVCLYASFVNFPRNFGHEDIIKGITYGCFKYCLPMLKNAFALENEIKHRKMGEQLFKTVVGLISESEDEFYAYRSMKRAASVLFDAEFSSVHLSDENFASKLIELYNEHKPSWRELEKMDVEEIRIPKSCRVAKTVAETGVIINCPEVKREPHAHANLFVRQDGELIIRNSLTFPMLLDDKVQGVIEVYNKLKGDGFTEDDEEYASGFGGACGLLIKCAKIHRKIKEKYIVRQFMDCVMLRDGAATYKKMDLSIPESVPLLPDLLHFTYNPYQMLEKDVTDYVVIIFCKLDILPKFKIDQNIFAKFICAVLNSTPSLPFHNACHVFNAFQFVLLLVTRCNIRYRFRMTLTEVLVLLLAAICQDMDWRGPTTAFQVIRGTGFQSLYTSPGMVEKRSTVSQLIRLITMNEFNILKNLDVDHFKLCLEMLHDLILATDLSYHKLKITSIKQMTKSGYDHNNVEHRKLFLSLLMTAGQLSIFTRSKDVFNEASVGSFSKRIISARKFKGS
ncbi:hypothetical protein O3M35_007556 [Rhynocoris fuscipes]|uniref:3',5'-cyclic-GMP phosphodiesterase n=1 Tax=Rhynocoris fuscipes TaxID=488301 RepID=A0AAW1DFK2_9HEMI